MTFRDFKELNSANYNFFEADELSYKGFIKLAFDEFTVKNGTTDWRLDIDNRCLNSYPNFTQRHQICISNIKFKDAPFQFRISSENSVHSLGYRLFINLDGTHLDFVANSINKTDIVVLEIKNQILQDFPKVSKCGWWLTDTWRDLHPISDDSDSENFILNLISHALTKDMLLINEKLLKAHISGELDAFIAKLKVQS